MNLHIKMLNSSYDRLHSLNPAFSLNSFARFLKLSASQLNEVLSGKCGISPEKSLKISEKLPISDSEKLLFVLSVKAHHSRRKSDRIKFQDKLQLELSTPSHKIKAESFNFISNWYIMAILELTSFEGFKLTAPWISKTLLITKAQAQEAIDCLKTLKLFKIESGKYIRKKGFIESTQDVPSEAIKNFHIQILEKAKKSLLEDELQKREFNSGMFTIADDDLPALKKELREFMSTTIKKYSKNKGKKTKLVSLSSQLFSPIQK